MTKRGTTGGSDNSKELRAKAGQWLKGLREQKGLTQLQLAKLLGYEYFTFISQIEIGKGAVPSAKYAAFARALDVDPKEFVKTCLKYYDPHAWEILWGGKSKG